MSQNVATPDFRHYPMSPGLASAEIEASWLRLRWRDGVEGRFHYIWLRDNAADATSIDAHSHERLFEILDFPLDVRPRSAQVDDDGVLWLEWGDLRCPYHPGWLRAYCYDLGQRDSGRPPVETWDASMATRLPTFDATAIVDDEGSRLQWLESIQRFGISLVTGSPTDSAAYIEWLESLLLIRDMNWGKHFDVIYARDAEYISNKGVDIPPHNDAATRPQMPGIQVFHCLKNTVEGGESLWVDGFHVAERLRAESPQDFDLLSTVPWTMANRHADSEYRCHSPFISLNSDGSLDCIRHTHWLREPLLADFDHIEPLYRAYRRFVQLAGDPANQVGHRLQPGEVSFIDNPRVFHARGPYTTGIGERHMQVSHSEREEIDSAVAVLRRRRRAAELNLEQAS